jgi:hypothetical protein
MAIEQENPNKVIKDYIEADGPKDWQWQPVAKDLSNMSDLLRIYFFRAKYLGEYEMPVPLLGLEEMDVRTLGAYYLKENALGLRWQISLNTKWAHRPAWELYETLCHEMVHLFQENHPLLEKCKHGYHNRQFVEICEEIGLHPKLGEGYHLRPADGQFARLMTRWGVEKPHHTDQAETEPSAKKNWWDDDRGGKPKGSSTMTLYTAEGCPKTPICKFRAGRKDLKVRCVECDGAFAPSINS